jgi:hypothetical protein
VLAARTRLEICTEARTRQRSGKSGRGLPVAGAHLRGVVAADGLRCLISRTGLGWSVARRRGRFSESNQMYQ